MPPRIYYNLNNFEFTKSLIKYITISTINLKTMEQFLSVFIFINVLRCLKSYQVIKRQYSKQNYATITYKMI